MSWAAIFMPGGGGQYETLADDAGNVKHFRSHAKAAHTLAALPDTDKARWVYSTTAETAYNGNGEAYRGHFILRRERGE